MDIKYIKQSIKLWACAVILALVLFNAFAEAQVPPTQTIPEVVLSVNHGFEPVSSQGWPLVLDLEVYHPDVGEGNGNVIPITLNLPTGSWADAVKVVVWDASGNVQNWPINLVFRPTGSQGSISLDAGFEGRLGWTVAPLATTNIPAGTYEIVAILDSTATTTQGAFSGVVASNPVALTLGTEPSPLTVDQQEEKYTLLASYDLLQGNDNQATTDLNTLLTNQPSSILAMTAVGDMLNLQGQPAEALQSYDRAVAAFAAAYPAPPEPPSALIGRQSSLRAAMISQSGLVAPPAITVALVGQSVQSPGVLHLDFLLNNIGTGVGETPRFTQFSYATVAGSGQVSYNTTLSPAVPFAVPALQPGGSTTARIYLDIPSTVNQFTLSLSGVAVDAAGTPYGFSATQTITPNSTETQSPLTITAGNATQQYGQATPALNNVTYSGFVNGDTTASLSGTLNCTTTATQVSPAGTYPITCSGLTSTNYTIAFAQGTLTVTAAPLTITPTNAARAYGAANPPLNNVAASGFVNGDTLLSLNGTLTCATSATPSSPAGVYPITCSGLTSPNYSISFVAGTLTVTPLVVSCVSNLNGRGTPSGRAPARIDVTWTGIPSAVSYNVLRSTVSGGPYTLLGNAVLPAFSDTNGLVNGGTYHYVVQPINSAGGVICQSNEAAIVIPNQPR
jgi:hypothetical protein